MYRVNINEFLKSPELFLNNFEIKEMDSDSKLLDIVKDFKFKRKSIRRQKKIIQKTLKWKNDNRSIIYAESPNSPIGSTESDDGKDPKIVIPHICLDEKNKWIECK